MGSNVSQYKLLYLFTWLFTCLLYPSWALPVSNPGRFTIYMGLSIYFFVSAAIMDRWFKSLSIKKIYIPSLKDYLKFFNDNRPFIVVLLLAVSFHIFALSFPISLSYDEPTHLMAGLGLYVHIQNLWSTLSNIPLQAVVIGFLTAALLLMMYRKQKAICSRRVPRLSSLLTFYETKRTMFILLVFSLLAFYFLLVYGLPYHPNIVRFPPIGKLLYLFSYLTTGINFIGPRVVQLAFYSLSSVYLYKSILLYRDETTAFLGSSIFLFSPLVFFYAHRGELASGNIFFIIIISYLFIRFIRDGNDAYLILCSLFISIGFLYKRTTFLMLFICIVYLIILKVLHRKFCLFKYVKVMMLSLVPVVPWMIIAKFFVWRQYEIVWSHLFSLDTLSSYLLLIPSQASWIIFALFLPAVFVSFIWKKDHLTWFIGLLFITYYLFFTADIMKEIDRYALVFYPFIALFTAQLISLLERKSIPAFLFKILCVVLIAYLALICTFFRPSSLNAKFVTYKNTSSRYFPTAKAMKWVKSNVKNNERILILHIPPALFYRDKYKIERHNIIDMWYKLDAIATPQELIAYCKKNDVSYIMFPHGTAHLIPHNKDILEYLEENQYNEFAPVINFNMDGNYIDIYRLKESR